MSHIVVVVVVAVVVVVIVVGVVVVVVVVVSVEEEEVVVVVVIDNDNENDDDDDDDNDNDNNNNNRIQSRKSIFFYSLFTAPRTVSSVYPQVARAQSRANHVQHIERLSRATCRVACHVVRRNSSDFKFDRVEITFILALSYRLNH